MNKNVMFLAAGLCLLTSCKVKESVGAYAPAQETKPAATAQVNTPSIEVKTTPQEPKTEPQRTSPIPPAHEPVIQENTRAEKFMVVEGEDETALRNYHVVVGSFKSETNARNLQNKMKPQYAPVIVINEQGMYRVLLISFHDYQAAKAKINAIKPQFPDAWVLIQKK